MNSQESDVRPEELDEELEKATESAVDEQEGGEVDKEESPQESGEEGGEPTSLEDEILKWRDLALRATADHENYRKRAAREREDAVRYANQSLLEELLPVLDNFEMGMQAAAQDEGSMIYIGMDMVRKQMNEFLGNCGVTEIEAEGKAFDPNLHDAVSQEAAEGVEEGTVLRVTRRGFMLRDRLLRPAAVIVAKEETEKD